jgi:signal transduction histidine kinase
MIEIVSIGGAVLLLTAVLWVARRFRQWNRDRDQLMQDVSELTTDALVLQESSSQAIIKFETTGIIRTVNPTAEELFGYLADELLGQNIVKLVPEALTASRLTETLEIRCKDGLRLRLPFRAVKSEGRISYIYLFFADQSKEAMPLDSGSGLGRDEAGDGASREAFGSLTQPPLWHAARIVGRIASQFETLLTTINGNGEFALMETSENSPLRHELEEIVTASDRASSLTRHLVAFSGGQLMPVEPVDLSRLVKGMQTHLREALACPIDFDLQPMEKKSLANVEYLREVILLLCGSALGRMRDTDRLRIRTRLCDFAGRHLVQSGELRPGTYGVLTISDSGRPLDAGIKEHLFEPLYLIHKDMGVELSPLYGIVQSLGGGIDLVTGDDIGTTFEILLPCESSTQAANA